MKCGYPYCVCVGGCFAQYSLLNDDLQLKGRPMTTIDHETLEQALEDAAKSLETISIQAGKSDYLTHMAEVRAYANGRAVVARAALAEAKQAVPKWGTSYTKECGCGMNFGKGPDMPLVTVCAQHFPGPPVSEPAE